MLLLLHLFLQSMIIARFGADDCDRSNLKTKLVSGEITSRCNNGSAGECSAVPNHYEKNAENSYQVVYVYKKDAPNACLDLKRLYFRWKMQEGLEDEPRANPQVIGALEGCLVNCKDDENPAAKNSSFTIRFLPHMCSQGYIIDQTPASIEATIVPNTGIKLISEDSKKHCGKYYEILDEIRKLAKETSSNLEADIVRECGLACGELSSGAIAAIVIATFIIVGVAGAAICYFIKQRSSE